MMGRGRPLRFLALVTVGWIGARIAILWPQVGSLPEAIRAVVPIADAAPARTRADPNMRVRATSRIAHHARPRAVPAQTRVAAIPPDDARLQLALLGLVRFGAPQSMAVKPVAIPAQFATSSIDDIGQRWSASAWFVARGGGGIGAAPGGGQLGGSQAGARIAYLVAPRQHLAAFARVSSPLSGRGREAALGLEWQPGHASIRFVAEQRWSLDGGDAGTGIGLVGGIDAALPAGFRLESYGQAGAIKRRRIEPYADGAARATRSIVEDSDARLALGAGAWGAAQRDVARLDLGPSATLALPVGGQSVRLALDWRQRVAGTARPGSGPALTIGSDF